MRKNNLDILYILKCAEIIRSARVYNPKNLNGDLPKTSPPLLLYRYLKLHILSLQDGKCGICEKELDLSSGCLDHNHSNNEIRGILCGSCNGAVGLYEHGNMPKTDPMKYEKIKMWARLCIVEKIKALDLNSVQQVNDYDNV